MSPFKFPVINPLLHNELRLKIMVVLDSLDSADFMYLCKITDSTRGSVSSQITTLKEAGYLDVTRTGMGRISHTVCRITTRGREGLRTYEDGLRRIFSQEIPSPQQSGSRRITVSP